jgi:hypothetical protein
MQVPLVLEKMLFWLLGKSRKAFSICGERNSGKRENKTLIAAAQTLILASLGLPRLRLRFYGGLRQDTLVETNMNC